MIEKHFILSREDGGVDSKFSLNKQELEELIQKLSGAAAAVASMEEFERSPMERDSLKFRRSLYFARDLKAGEVIQEGDIRRVRPGFGLKPSALVSLVGRKLRVGVDVGTPVTKRLFEV
jgi:N-acetylneuraminate synthase